MPNKQKRNYFPQKITYTHTSSSRYTQQKYENEHEHGEPPFS